MDNLPHQPTVVKNGNGEVGASQHQHQIFGAIDFAEKVDPSSLLQTCGLCGQVFRMVDYHKHQDTCPNRLSPRFFKEPRVAKK